MPYTISKNGLGLELLSSIINENTFSCVLVDFAQFIIFSFFKSLKPPLSSTKGVEGDMQPKGRGQNGIGDAE